MNQQSISGGTVHKMTNELRTALLANPESLKAWERITPLARNEWLCWVESAKQIETKSKRLKRTWTELAEGKRRPCCWIGCIHRADKAMSPSQKFIINRNS